MLHQHIVHLAATSTYDRLCAPSMEAWNCTPIDAVQYALAPVVQESEAATQFAALVEWPERRFVDDVEIQAWAGSQHSQAGRHDRARAAFERALRSWGGEDRQWLSGDDMKITGIILFFIGGFLLLGGAGMDVSAAPMSSSPYSFDAAGRVANLHAMHIQSLIVQGGFASFFVGAILFGFGSVVERLEHGAPVETADRPDAGQSPGPEPIGWPHIAVAVVFLIAVAAVVVFLNRDAGNGGLPTNLTDMPSSQDAANAINQAEADIANALGTAYDRRFDMSLDNSLASPDAR